MEKFEKLLDRVVITEYSWEDSSEHEYILEDKSEGFFCIGTNGDPICCDSREEAEAEDYLDGIDEGCSWTLREFLTQECGWDNVEDIEDDDMFYDILHSRLGCGEVCWLRNLAEQSMQVSLDYGETYMSAEEAMPEIVERDLWDDLVLAMDNDVREAVHLELAPCSKEEFLERYLALAPADLVIG